MSDLIIFEDDAQQVEVRLEGETVWLSQSQMAALFDTSTDNIGLHLKNIYKVGELDEGATTEDFSVVRQEGSRQVKRRLKHYNLDAIISVGYRVSSMRATRFRQWATRVLRQHLTQGYSLNEHRLAQRGLTELEQAVHLLGETLVRQELVGDIGRLPVSPVLAPGRHAADVR
ncbi:virulence RhuM family protein [Spiribacter insolitus]|uniref:RhuM family protein n=1 Tax=Spiribacter insolitus TaxID=3122417 RepID=A0ABV3T6T5_9GAMM